MKQVFVFVPIVQSEKIALKSYMGKYLTISRYGVCEALAEAIGPEQEFEFVKPESGNGWSIKSVWEKFLSIDEKDIRCDSEIIGTKSTLMYSFFFLFLRFFT